MGKGADRRIINKSQDLKIQMIVRKIIYKQQCLDHSFSHGGYFQLLSETSIPFHWSSTQMLLLASSFLDHQPDYSLCFLYAL